MLNKTVSIIGGDIPANINHLAFPSISDILGVLSDHGRRLLLFPQSYHQETWQVMEGCLLELVAILKIDWQPLILRPELYIYVKS